MKKLFCMLIVAMATPLLSGCYGKGSSADPPANFTAVAGDGRVMLTWTTVPGVDYWLFTATEPSLTAFNWTGLAHAYAKINAPTPFYMCGLIDGLPYYFAANGRINGGPGGSSSPTISATPYNASANWVAAAPASGVPATTNLNGVGYTSLTTCGNIATISATGMFAAVGAGGAIFTSSDGLTWNNPTSPISTDLYAATGYAASQNNPTSPGLRWVAVGAGGASVYSTDGITWTVGNAANSNSLANPNNYALRSMTQVGGTFYAVGDAGTIISSPDGITWTHRPYNAANATTQNLNGVTHGTIYVAVGDSGTILTSGDGNTWTAQTSGTPNNLRQVTFFGSIYGSIYAAVGDGGMIVTSKDGTTWTTQTLTGSPNLVGITVETRAVDPPTASIDPSLGFISTAQFVAIDSAGNAYTSVNGYTWSAAIPTGAASLNTLVGSGFGYVAAGNAGTTAYAF